MLVLSIITFKQKLNKQNGAYKKMLLESSTLLIPASLIHVNQDIRKESSLLVIARAAVLSVQNKIFL